MERFGLFPSRGVILQFDFLLLIYLLCVCGYSHAFFFCLRVGKLERSAVLKAICAGFKETTDPPICLSEGFDVRPTLYDLTDG